MWIIFVIQFEALHDYSPLIARSIFIEYKIKEVDDPDASSHLRLILGKRYNEYCCRFITSNQKSALSLLNLKLWAEPYHL